MQVMMEGYTGNSGSNVVMMEVYASDDGGVCR
jgi:hypothetical protein